MEYCKWLNRAFGDGYWICKGFLKKCDPIICSKCKANTVQDKKEEKQK